MVTVAAVIDEIKTLNTKNNTVMSFVKISDCSGYLETVVFNKTYETYRDTLEVNNVIALKEKVSIRNGERSVVIEALKTI